MAPPSSRLRRTFTPAARSRLRARSWTAGPSVGDRAAWSHMDPEQIATIAAAARDAHARALQDPPTVTTWRLYTATGSRSEYQRAQGHTLEAVGHGALALAATGDEEWVEPLIQDIWRLCELTSWCLPAHYRTTRNGVRGPFPVRGEEILDLACAFIGAMLASIDTVVGERLEERVPGLRRRLHQEIHDHVLVPWRRDTYFWHGLEDPPNNWAPWIVSNVLVCSSVVEESVELLAEDIDRGLVILDRFVDGYAPDGSCDEGASYWWWAGGSLFEALELIDQLTGGEAQGLLLDPIPAMARFPMTMQIDPQRQVNYADGSSRTPGAASWHMLSRFAEAVGDKELGRHSRWMGQHHPFRLPTQIAPSFRRFLAEFRDPGWSASDAAPGIPQSWYAPGTETAVARERAGDTSGWFLAVQGGHNDVSHNHNDIGTPILFLDGEPVLIDVGVGVYRRETFDPQLRYGIWTMRSAFHSVPLPGAAPGEPLPEIGGIEQSAGQEFRASGTEAQEAVQSFRVSMDLATAYPEAAGLEKCRRTVVLDREASEVTLQDAWTFREDRTMTLVLMTAQEPHVERDHDGAPIGLVIGAARIELAAPGDGGLRAEVQTIEITDAALHHAWGDRVHRVLLTTAAASAGDLTLRVRRA